MLLRSQTQAKAEAAAARPSTPMSVDSDENELNETITTSTELEKSLKNIVQDLTERISILEMKPISTCPSTPPRGTLYTMATPIYTMNSVSDNLPSQVAPMPRSNTYSLCNSLPSCTSASHALPSTGPLTSPYSNCIPATTGNMPYRHHIPMFTAASFMPSNMAHAPASMPFSPSQGNNMWTPHTMVSTPRKLYDLPEFNGRPEDWPIFLTSFNESAIAYGLENTLRLQKCLKGAAREEVECLLIDPRNVSEVIEHLRFRFGQPELLVRSQLMKVKEILPIPENRLERMVSFASSVRNLTVFLKTASAEQHLQNPTLLEELIVKMPMTKRVEWTSYSMQIHPYPTLEHFEEWVSRYAKVIGKATMHSLTPTSRLPSKPVLTVNEPLNSNEETKQCVECPEYHHLSKCRSYLDKDVKQRWEIVKSHKLCFSCLAKGHSMYQCKKKLTCTVDGCRKSHHSTLHEPNMHVVTTNVPPITLENDTQQINTVQTSKFNHNTTKILYKILPIELRGINNRTVKTFALIDEGSSCTLINEAVANQLGITGQNYPLSLQWFGGRETKIRSMKLEMQIRGAANNAKWYDLKAQTVPSLDLPMQTVTFSELHPKYQQLKNLPIADYTDAEPTVLIGLDNCHLTASLRSIQCEDSIVAVKAALGWFIYGKKSHECKQTAERVSTILHTSTRDDIHELIADYFTTENFGVAMTKAIVESKDVVRARRILSETTKKIGRKYECGLLWKSDDVHLPDSFDMALNRFQSIERKMMNDVEFAKAYKTAMSSFIKSGYARKLEQEELKIKTKINWYMPHFAVFNVNKPGKLRIVFDAAAAVNRVSLNSVLLKGPDEVQPLVKILLQFREGIIGICADIKEMFLQVGIRQQDQNAQRFLWRYDNNDPIETYVMTSMIFGATCSPCIAQHVKNRNAEEIASDRPEVIKAITDNHYVDDFVCSFGSEHEALDIGQAVLETHFKAGFVLRNFTSNSQSVQNHLNKSIQQMQPIVKMNAGSQLDKVLGMCWDSEADAFVFQLKLHRVDPLILEGEKCPTKRQLPSLVMSIYDPFGMLADIMVYGKILLQSLWRKGIEWDDEVPPYIFNMFSSWVRKLRMVEQLKVSRCYAPEFLSLNATIELHVFVDASEQAFAAVAYWRIVYAENVKIRFVLGKTRCAPLKLLSVPRLELQAAVLGSRLKNTVIGSHSIKPVRTILWTDSKTVLLWIKSDHRQYKPFVAHRVSEILDETHENEWRWCPSHLNAADEATRAAYPLRDDMNSRWIQGPDFLLEREELWPVLKTSITDENTDKEKRNCLLVIPTEKLIDLKSFSDYLRLKRTMAWVIRFITNAKNKSIGAKGHSGELTSSELQEAQFRLCQIVQREAFPNEIEQLKNNKAILKNSDIYKLTPQINEDGVLCVQGRLDYAAVLTKNTRRPIILPYRHDFTELVVQWYHQRLYHQNNEIVISEIRKTYWVPHLRAAVKRAQSMCQQCKNFRAIPRPPLMGQLPIDRVTPYVRPFAYTGLDYFGPILVTIGRRTEKRWAALFTCLTIRAIHIELAIELARDLSTDACILCIRNFVNRRGVPVKIRSDMGTNFVGANGELGRVADIFDSNYIQNELSAKGITWEFNCPANPSSGGCWERLIQSVKKVLAFTLKEKTPQVDTLNSLLIEAENIVNSRPLTHLPVTPEEPDPLTPNHFLLGVTNSTQTPGDEGMVATRKQYRISQQLKNQFWSRWIKEYLPTLTKRTKWFAPQPEVKVGDVVIICDSNLPRSEWKRGMVASTIKAKDGQVRLADVKIKDGMLRRPVSKLAVLDVLG